MSEAKGESKDRSSEEEEAGLPAIQGSPSEAAKGSPRTSAASEAHTPPGSPGSQGDATEMSELGKLVTSDQFGHASTGLVIINLVVMCCPYAGMTPEYEAKLENLSLIHI